MTPPEGRSACGTTTGIQPHPLAERTLDLGARDQAAIRRFETQLGAGARNGFAADLIGFLGEDTGLPETDGHLHDHDAVLGSIRR